ncbi:hypothetical protein D9756_006231 [Leucocoprinus leucothites]|uniref:Uncharacterized protein n=1 Tax=Leucocoprinus leucothites TaxID=201217 RepID=A0A8H5FWQ5_9AGAR|nr:hypothetical protein D9756_006231 [Leucoagaricus leucothites]
MRVDTLPDQLICLADSAKQIANSHATASDAEAIRDQTLKRTWNDEWAQCSTRLLDQYEFLASLAPALIGLEFLLFFNAPTRRGLEICHHVFLTSMFVGMTLLSFLQFSWCKIRDPDAGLAWIRKASKEKISMFRLIYTVPMALVALSLMALVIEGILFLKVSGLLTISFSAYEVTALAFVVYYVFLMAVCHLA